jgi:hypothetical protein
MNPPSQNLILKGGWIFKGISEAKLSRIGPSLFLLVFRKDVFLGKSPE